MHNKIFSLSPSLPVAAAPELLEKRVAERNIGIMRESVCARIMHACSQTQADDLCACIIIWYMRAERSERTRSHMHYARVDILFSRRRLMRMNFFVGARTLGPGVHYL